MCVLPWGNARFGVARQDSQPPCNTGCVFCHGEIQVFQARKPRSSVHSAVRPSIRPSERSPESSKALRIYCDGKRFDDVGLHLLILLDALLISPGIAKNYWNSNAQYAQVAAEGYGANKLKNAALSLTLSISSPCAMSVLGFN